MVRVRQLERNWYTVRLYAEQDWNGVRSGDPITGDSDVEAKNLSSSQLQTTDSKHRDKTTILWSNRSRIEAESDEISMTAEQITSQPQPLIGEIYFQHFCYLLVESRIAAGIGPEEVIEPVLHFMEQNTGVDFGLPGPLIQFMERSMKQDQARRDCFEELLIKSCSESL